MATNTIFKDCYSSSTKFLLTPTLHTRTRPSSQLRCSASTFPFSRCKVLDGKLVAKQIMEETAAEISWMKNAKGVVPGLAGIHFGDQNEKDFGCFLRTKKRACESVGINYFHFHLPDDCTMDDLTTRISMLNNDCSVHGIFLRLPLPQTLYTALDHETVFNAISREKNVDDVLHFHLPNFRGTVYERLFVPSVARGFLALLRSYNINIRGKVVLCILGRHDDGNFYKGISIANLLRSDSSIEVHVCMGIQQSLSAKADIIISALGETDVLGDCPMKPGVVVIDVGNYPKKDKRSRGGFKFKVVGDADDDYLVRNIASAISPVPGGIGPVAITMLLSNTLMAAKLIHNFSSH